MNNEVMFSSKTDLWETPQEFFDRLNDEFRFDLDVCALPENAKCDQYYTPEQDGLSQLWKGVCWCNPPYGRDVCKWVEKAHYSTYKGITTVMLLPARTDTKWFHNYNNFSIGDKVELTPDMKLLATRPEKYGIGEVVGVGSWGIVDVLWSGFSTPIGMRSDELKTWRDEP